MTLRVTGGGGFLGGGIVRALLKLGHRVRSFSRGDYPKLREMGVETVQGDISDPDAVARAVEGCQAVFHAAAKAGIWGSYGEYHRSNVLGTKNVIDACRKAGVDRLVFTSSPSVVFHRGGHEGADESAPYPLSFLNSYSRTKAMAEKEALAANRDGLLTVSLRPHMIWGPGDNHLVPRLVARAKEGRLFLVGDGKNLVDSTYIDNAVDAHLLAFNKLAPGSPICGRAYFITNGEPVPMGELINMVLNAAGLPPVAKRIPSWAAYALGAAMEFGYGALGRKEEPRMTRFLAMELSRPHWYDISAAGRDLGYRPGVSLRQGMNKLAEWLGRPQGRDGE
jgi:nucleoside-diphosphate-sugar epimerase